MGLLSLLIGLFTLLIMMVAFIPLIGWLNWFNLPVALVGLAFGVAARTSHKGSQLGTIGSVLCGTAVIVGIIRLFIGCGVI